MRKRLWLWSPAPKEDHTYPAAEILSSASLVIASSGKQEAPTEPGGSQTVKTPNISEGAMCFGEQCASVAVGQAGRRSVSARGWLVLSSVVA